MRRFAVFGFIGAMPFWFQWLVTVIGGETHISCNPSIRATLFFVAFMGGLPFVINGTYAIENGEKLDKSGLWINLFSAFIATAVVLILDAVYRYFCPDSLIHVLVAVYFLVTLVGAFAVHKLIIIAHT